VVKREREERERGERELETAKGMKDWARGFDRKMKGKAMDIRRGISALKYLKRRVKTEHFPFGNGKKAPLNRNTKG
jgi:hypothetical protein